MVLLLASAFALWGHTVGFPAEHSPHLAVGGHALGVLLDAMLGVPFATAAVWLAGRTAAVVAGAGERFRARVAFAALVSLYFVPLFAPLAGILRPLHEMLGLGAQMAAHHPAGAGPNLPELAMNGLWTAIAAQPFVLTVALLTATPAIRRSGAGGRGWRAGRWRSAVVAASVPVLAAAQLVVPIAPPAPVASAAEDPAAAPVAGCAGAPIRTYNVLAINIDITVDRFGDHDPFGFMYVLADKLSEVRAQEAALKANAAPGSDGRGAKVASGLGLDPIQPLVLRARLGECLVINLTNRLTDPPRGGPGFGDIPVLTQPGGVPSVSVDIAGVSHDAAGGSGGQAVGNNPLAVQVPPGGTHTYRYFLDPLMGEGPRVFSSGGDSVELTAHGLFGTLVVEPPDSTWLDPETGADRTNDPKFNSFAAIIRPGRGTNFREFVLAYHEIGNEQFALRRPPRDDGSPTNCFANPDGNGAPLPMRDEGGLANCGTETEGYRPGSRALNYRAEPFFRRQELLVQRKDADETTLPASESLMYGSYLNGDPATPIARSYLGEPTKTRLVHAGWEQLHVHHLHGGADRWPMNPNAVADNSASGLQKFPPTGTSSINLDSQTIGPREGYDLRHECGAGGCQQAAADFLFHCHIAHHYIAGMWGIWRVFNTRQPNLATIPGRAPAPDAVTSQGLLGKRIEGKTVVPRAGLNDPNTQIAVEDLVERQLPPPGVPRDDTDATVLDWVNTGPPSAPLYLNEPEDDEVWPNFESATPGQRQPILFNPGNGRPANPWLRPHLGKRPPFAPGQHSGAPYLGNTTSPTRPDGLCPASAPVKKFDITAISVPIQQTLRERDANGMVYVLNQDKDRVIADARSGARSPDPLVIRSNVGDCVEITFSSELDPAVMQKVNMHTHFVQFDPQGSDGVITGFNFEQSVYQNQRQPITLAAPSAVNARQLTVSSTVGLRPGVAVAVGAGRPNIEIRTITAINGNTLTLDRGLGQAHAAGERVTVEFTQHRWYSDVDSGTVFWHDHVKGIESWSHGLFAAHIIEPKGSTYHDPRTGNQIQSGPIADIRTTGQVGVGVRGAFREFMVFLHNGRRGRPELNNPNLGRMDRNAGQECEEGAINLRAAPIGERTPPGAGGEQRQEFNGSVGENGVCRNAISNDPDPTGNNTVQATVTAVDPYAFSSVKYGDPTTPLFRAYAGDPVVIRTIGVGDKIEALRLQGHRFARERFNADGELVDAATTGISERFDYVLDGGAGGPAKMAGDYLYYSTRNFAFESGAWGVFRVHDRLVPELRPLPDRAAPPGGAGFPILRPATGDTQQTPGPNPPPPSPEVITSGASPCPASAPRRAYDVSVFDMPLPTRPTSDTGGIVYSLTSDLAAIKNGTKKVEPLVLRANHGDCVEVTLRNQIAAGTPFGGTRAGFDLGKLLYNPQISAGTAVGLNPDTTVAAGQTIRYQFAADKQLGTAVFQNLGSVASMRHGAYGLLIVEPAGSTWSNSADNAPLGPTATSTQAIIRSSSGNFREFALAMGTTDQQYARSIVPYQDVVAGAGVNSVFAGNPPVANLAFNQLNYATEPLTTRLGLNTNPPNPNANFGAAFSSRLFGDPATPIFRTITGDPVVFRVGIGATDQFHTFALGGHVFPQEPNMWNGGSDRRSQLLASRSVTAGETMEVEVVGGAGGTARDIGDYLYANGRKPFTEAGIWGIFRVLPSGSPGVAPI